MAKSGMVILAAALMSWAALVEGDAAARGAGPPVGLTSHGRTVWNLDALLHDTFGARPVFLAADQRFPRSPRNFTTVQGADCCSDYYIYTFANARRSAFKTMGPTRPPRSEIGAAGYEVPLTIRGAYIYCGGNRWLFEHGGNGPANWQITCHR
jgi:hypothetical protein